MKNDYRVTVKVRNNNLLKAIEATGLSPPALAAKIGISYVALNRLVNMTASPFDRHGKVRAIVEALCIALETPFDALFSEAQCTALVSNKSERELNAEQVYGLTYNRQYAAIEHDDGLADTMADALKRLKPNERFVIEKRFGFDGEPMTLEAIGEEIGRSVERIRQIESKALRVLRQPSVAAKMLDYAKDL